MGQSDQRSMDPDTSEKFASVLRDPEAQRRIKTEMVRKLLEALPEAADRTREQARVEGRVEGVRHAVLALLAARRLAVSPAQQARIEQASDLAQLDAWLAAAVSAEDTETVLRATPALAV